LTGKGGDRPILPNEGRKEKRKKRKTALTHNFSGGERKGEKEKRYPRKG